MIKHEIRWEYILVICIILGTLPCNAQSVIPMPKEMVMGEGSWDVSADTRINYSNDALTKTVSLFNNYLDGRFGVTLKKGSKGKNAIHLQIDKKMPLEAYSLVVDDKGVTIKGSEAGIFYGIQTLQQLLVDKGNGCIQLPYIMINDEPRFGYRGLMLDVARYFYSVEYVKEYIDLMARYKINRFHWHLTEDAGWRIEIKKYPELTKIGAWRNSTQWGHNPTEQDRIPHGGFYTQEQIKEIIQYAADRYITIVPEIDLPELAEYARNKGVGLILWAVMNVLDEQLEKACRYYAGMGIKGFKVDFLDRDDQKAVEMVYRIAETTAKYKLFVDFHGMYKPTGINRTFPNAINFEGVFGMEELKWSNPDMPLYDVTMPFIRMMAGNVDYTQGAMRNAVKKDFRDIYSSPMSQGTRCHQLATYIVFDSPLVMLCDAPTAYRKEPECTRFIAGLPVVADETRILQGKMGEYIVTARRVGEDWIVGGLTDWEARTVDLDLSFLPEGMFRAEIFCDGINADKKGEDYRHEYRDVKREDRLKMQLAPGGGFAIRLKKNHN